MQTGLEIGTHRITCQNNQSFFAIIVAQDPSLLFRLMIETNLLIYLELKNYPVCNFEVKFFFFFFFWWGEIGFG